MSTYEYGPNGMPRVERMPDAVLDSLIRHSRFSSLDSFSGEDRKRLHSLMHDTAEEVLARLPAWLATPSEAAPAGRGAQDTLNKLRQLCNGGPFDLTDSPKSFMAQVRALLQPTKDE